MKKLYIALLLCIFGLLVIGYSESAPVENIILNPDFERGTGEWQLEIHADFINAQMESDNSDSITDKRSVRIDVLNRQEGAEAWRLQFKQIGHTVRAGRKYTWTFWARSDKRPRAAELWVGMDVDPWAGLGGGKSIIITEEWKEYRLTFTANQDFANTRLAIQLGQDTVSVWIDHVRFYEGDYVEDDDIDIDPGEDPKPKKGDNLLINPNFELGTAGWNLEVHEGFVVAKMSVDKTDGIGDRQCVRIDINNIQQGAEVWRLQFKQSSLAIKANKTYTWAFWARSSDFRLANIWIGMEVDPWVGLGPSEEIMLEPEWKEYHFTFQPNQDFDNTRLSIQLAGSDEPVWVDRARFYEGKYDEEDIKEDNTGKSVRPLGKQKSAWGEIKDNVLR